MSSGPRAQLVSWCQHGAKRNVKAKRKAASPSRSARRPRTPTERVQLFRKRRLELSSEATGFVQMPSGARNQVDNVNHTSLTASVSFVRDGPVLFGGFHSSQSWERATVHFKKTFLENEFGHKSNVCDRLWFLRDLKAIDSGVASFLAEYFPEENTAQFILCGNCFKVCKSHKIPYPAVQNKPIAQLLTEENYKEVSLVGIVHEVCRPYTFNAQDETKSNQNVVLVDDSKKCVTLTLWGEHVRKLDGHEGSSVQFEHVSTREYNGKRTLSSTASTGKKNGPFRE